MADEVINPYTDIEQAALPSNQSSTQTAGQSSIAALRELNTGAPGGDLVFRSDQHGIWLGAGVFADALFSVSMAGYVKGLYGEFGGFQIGADYIIDSDDNMGLSSAVTGGDDIRMWFGTSKADKANAPVRFYESGLIVIGDIGSGTYLIIDGPNNRIYTSDYSTGVRGWNIDNLGAEFANVKIRGVISASVLEKSVASVIGGELLVANSDALDEDMTAADNSTVTIKATTTFAVNDILWAKDATNEEFMRITDISSAPTYVVQRDLLDLYTANNNPVWTAGTAIMKKGSSDGVSTYDGGFLRLLGEGTHSPKFSVFKRTGIAADALTEMCVFGNLNGLLDYVTDEYGVGIGDLVNGYMSYDQTNGLRVNGGLNNQTAAVCGEDITSKDPCVIRTNDIVKQVASHDAKVLQTSAGSNYGTDTTAVIGSNNTTNNGVSYFYVKFDLSTINIPIADKAHIRLRVDSAGFTGSVGGFDVGVYEVTGADWDESTITWTNKPAIAAVSNTWDIANGDQITDDFIEEDAAEPYVFLDITTMYNAWKAGGNNYGVAIRYTTGGAEHASAVRTMTVATSEHATTAFRPTIIVSGVSSNVGKIYKASAATFTGIYGRFGFATLTKTSGQTGVLQRSGIVTGLSGLTAGKTYYVNDAGALSLTPGTIMREVGVALSSTTLDMGEEPQRIVSDRIILQCNDSSTSHNSTNSIFIPIGFKPKMIRFEGKTKAGGVGNIHTAIGTWQNGAQQTILVSNSSPIVTSGYLVYDVPSINEAATLTVTSVEDTGVLLTFTLTDDTTNDSTYIDGFLTFER